MILYQAGGVVRKAVKWGGEAAESLMKKLRSEKAARTTKEAQLATPRHNYSDPTGAAYRGEPVIPKGVYGDTPPPMNREAYRAQPLHKYQIQRGHPSFAESTDEGLDLLDEMARNEGRNPNLPGGLQRNMGEAYPGSHTPFGIGNVHHPTRHQWSVPYGNAADESYMRHLQAIENYKFFKQNPHLKMQ